MGEEAVSYVKEKAPHNSKARDLFEERISYSGPVKWNTVP